MYHSQCALCELNPFQQCHIFQYDQQSGMISLCCGYIENLPAEDSRTFLVTEDNKRLGIAFRRAAVGSRGFEPHD